MDDHTDTPHLRRAKRRGLRTLALAGALIATAALAAVPAGAFDEAHVATTHEVSLSGFSFRPSTLTIKRGDTVTWSWHIPKSEHNVTFRSVHSRTGSSGSLSVKFPNAGSFSYVCTVHVAKGMKGKIVVH